MELDARVYDMDRLQSAVMRDLEDLLNHPPLAQVLGAGADLEFPVHNLDEYAGVSETVINFGFPNLVGTTPGESALEGLRQRMKRVLMDFEPRLDERSIRVEFARADHTKRNDVAFRIQATLLGRPMPVIQTVTDLTSGRTGVAIAPPSAPAERTP